RQKQLPANPGGPRRGPVRGSGGTAAAPGKPRSAQPRSCPKENGPAAAPRRPTGPRDGSTGDSVPAKGKGRGAARSTPGASGVSQNGPTGTGVAAKSKGKGRGAAPAPTKLLAMDCEMVGTGPGGRTSALARCSIVTYEGD
ncbi:AEN nuclease, partial [Neodrepanis coruscans]|nr:AEN nuclease [Neodrepanis coruscans]